ncbi:MAG: DinB family protein [Saprospiraceae bacterium]|nr:DinB family protein [Saprospiraceae bacterium]
MDNSLKEILWNQFGASIDMLINVIASSPEGYNESNKRFYYIAYHSAIFLDYYLTIPQNDFSQFLPFTFKEKDVRPKEAIDDLVPDKIYSKQEIIEFLKLSRLKCRALIESLSIEKLTERFKAGDDPKDMDYPILEILLYNMRHTQHHAAQLNMYIRNDFDQHMEWSFRAGDINNADILK